MIEEIKIPRNVANLDYHIKQVKMWSKEEIYHLVERPKPLKAGDISVLFFNGNTSRLDFEFMYKGCTPCFIESLTVVYKIEPCKVLIKARNVMTGEQFEFPVDDLDLNCTLRLIETIKLQKALFAADTGINYLHSSSFGIYSGTNDKGEMIHINPRDENSSTHLFFDIATSAYKPIP